MPKFFTKQPVENKDYDFDWSDWMPTGDSISTASIPNVDGITLGPKTVTGNVVKQFISGGADGVDYKITCTMTTTQGRIDEREIRIMVREL